MDVRKAVGVVVVAAGIGGYLPGVPGLIGGGSDPIEDPPEDLALTEPVEPVQRPPAPPVTELTRSEPAEFEDGLVRLVVTPTADVAAWLEVADDTVDPAPTPAADPAPDAELGADSDPTPPPAPVPATIDIPFAPSLDQTTIDPRLLDLLVVSAVLTFDDYDRPWATWPDGARFPLWSIDEWPDEALIDLGLADDPDATPTPAPTDEPETDAADAEPTEPIESVGHPVMDAIAAVEGVESVRSVGDGSFAVALEDPTVLEEFPVESTEDTLMAISAERYESYQWALDNTGENLDGVAGAPPQHADADVDGAEARTAATGAGVVVAVVDSGVDFGHPDLAPNQWRNEGEECDNGLDDDGNGFVDDCHGWDFAYDDNTPWNRGAHPHGTHVAGIIGAAENGEGVVGIAPEVRIMDLNVGAITPSGQPGITTTAVARAIRYAADNGADVINLSLGTPPGSPRQGSLPVEQAIQHAEARGVLVVAAAGNDGTNLDLAPGWPASYELSNMITVGASTPSDSRAGFSNYGAVVDVFAPGVLILSSVPNGQLSFMSGTSQATPIVAGTAALALQARPGRSPAELRTLLADRTADRHELLVPFVHNGVRVNAGAVVGITENRHDITEVAVDATGLVGLTAAQAFTATLAIAMPDDHPADPLEWELTLLAVGREATYAVVEHPVVVAGVETATDGGGAVPLGLQASGSVDLDLALPAGDYALVLEAVPEDDPTTRVGDPRVVRFAVAAAPVAAEPAPADPVTPAGDGGDEADEGEGAAEPGTAAPAPAEPSVGDDAPAPDPQEPAADPAPPGDDDATPPSTGTDPGSASPPGEADDSPAAEPADPATPAPDAQPAPPPTDPAVPAPSPGDPAVPAEPSGPAGEPVTSGDWTIRSVSPGEGLVNVTNVVELRGSFPHPAYAWFGDAPGTVLLQTAELMIVLTPPRTTPGTVDVELRQAGAGSVVTMLGGYTFVDPFAPSPDPAPADPGSDGSDDGTPTADAPAGGDAAPAPPAADADAPAAPADADPTPPPTGEAGEAPGEAETVPADPPGAEPTPTVAPADPVGAEPGEPEASTGLPSNRQSRMGVAGDIELLENGLSGVAIVSGDPSTSASVCAASPCRLD